LEMRTKRPFIIMSKLEMSPLCSCPTAFIGHPSPSSSFPCKRESRFVFHPDGSPPTTCGDDRREWSCPTAFIGNLSPSQSFPTVVIVHPSWLFSDGPRQLLAGRTDV
jgi:hypothetical protein